MLNSSIALHFILDVYEQTTVFNIRWAYNRETHISDNCKEVISKEGDYFFHAYKAERLRFVEKQISSADCKINLAVPSNLI